MFQVWAPKLVSPLQVTRSSLWLSSQQVCQLPTEGNLAWSPTKRPVGCSRLMGGSQVGSPVAPAAQRPVRHGRARVSAADRHRCVEQPAAQRGHCVDPEPGHLCGLGGAERSRRSLGWFWAHTRPSTRCSRRRSARTCSRCSSRRRRARTTRRCPQQTPPATSGPLSGRVRRLGCRRCGPSTRSLPRRSTRTCAMRLRPPTRTSRSQRSFSRAPGRGCRGPSSAPCRLTPARRCGTPRPRPASTSRAGSRWDPAPERR